MKENCRFLIGQILLFILNHVLTIKRNKIQNRKTGEKLKGAKFFGFFGFYLKIDLDAVFIGGTHFCYKSLLYRKFGNMVIFR